MAEDGLFGRPSVKIYLDTLQEKASSIQLFFAPTCGNLSLGYPLSGLPRVLGRVAPETTLPGPELDKSKERHPKDERRTTGCVSATLHTHPSMRSLRLSSDGATSTLTVPTMRHLDMDSTTMTACQDAIKGAWTVLGVMSVVLGDKTSVQTLGQQRSTHSPSK